MALNVVLLLLVFGAAKKKINPYAAASLLGVVKFGLYAVFSGTVAGPLVVGIIYAGLAVAFVYFLQRIDRREDKERPDVPVYTSAGADRVTFKWEYIPLVILLMLIIGGEILLRFVPRGGT